MRDANVPAPSANWCLFLDVDGTLIEFGDSPADTRVDDDLKRLLRAVDRNLGGSLALVSGRSIENLDAMFAPSRFAAAGLHGVERRGLSGEIQRAQFADAVLDRARASMRAFVDRNPGAILEDKGAALALHFRMTPHLEQSARRLLSGIAADLGERFHLLEGDKVVEIKPSLVNKATAIEAFLLEAPFLGRTPVFVGDDITDQDGFRAVELHGGVSIAVGDRVSAQWRLENSVAVRAWLERIAAMGDQRS